MVSLSFAYLDMSQKPKAKYKITVFEDGSFVYEFKLEGKINDPLALADKDKTESLLEQNIIDRFDSLDMPLEDAEVHINPDMSFSMYVKTEKIPGDSFYLSGDTKKFSLEFAGLSVGVMQVNYGADVDFRVVLPKNATVLSISPSSGVINGNVVIWSNPDFADDEPVVEYVFLKPVTSLDGVVERVKLSVRETNSFLSTLFLALATISLLLTILRRSSRAARS